MPSIPMMYTFDPHTRVHTGSRPAQVVGGKALTQSSYATTMPPPASIPEGHVARWTGTAWETVEDHRQHMDSKGTKTGGTPYWLPAKGDDWQSPARYIEDLGPLPAGAVTVRPEKPAPTEAELFRQLRAERDRRLTATDYLLMQDYPLDDTLKGAVQLYRQALRDLPSQEGAPWDGGAEDTPWPEIPNVLQERQGSSTSSVYTPGVM
ncbi:tail fiber assembly protein [Desulfovibrio piger]|uniref:tail fiber assembly protein n=1 Tax=Desulfovibrio piger TaxID=901 RepID=UPI0032C0BF38